MPALDTTMSVSLVDFFGGVFVRLANCVWLSDGGALLSKYTVLHRKDLTLKFLKIRVARWYYCQIFFMVTYSYPNCKVLYEDCLISSHIFIPDHPHLLDPSLTSRGKDKSWTSCGGFRQLLGEWSKKIVQLKHFHFETTIVQTNLYCIINTYCLWHLQPVKSRM